MCDTGILYYKPAIQTRAQLLMHPHVQAHTHPDPIFTTNAEHLLYTVIFGGACTPLLRVNPYIYSGK